MVYGVNKMDFLVQNALQNMNTQTQPTQTVGQANIKVVGCGGGGTNVTNWLYKKKNLKRVYFSAFVPTVPDHLVPQSPIPLLREHRLYQADWLMRFYNFQLEDLVLKDDHNLSLDLDPKMAHALKNRERFPLEINRASYQDLLKVPGIGPLAAKRLYRARKEHHFTNLQELKNLGVVTKRAKPFILINGVKQGNISEIVTVKQLELFEGYSSSLAWAQAPQLLT